MAPGIGIKQLFMKFMKAYCIDGGGSSDESARLVFCLHASGQEDILRGALLADGVPYSRLPININNKMNQTTRAAMYSRGGCFFITARIMIVDLLNENLISRNVCGMLVYDADRVGELSMEAFILKLFKEQNPNGFIKVCVHRMNLRPTPRRFHSISEREDLTIITCRHSPSFPMCLVLYSR